MDPMTHAHEQIAESLTLDDLKRIDWTALGTEANLTQHAVGVVWRFYCAADDELPQAA